MFNVPLVSWIANAAAVLFGGHGAVSEQAEKAGCSRQTAYDHALAVQEALEEAHLPGPSRGQLLEEVQSLRQQLDQQLDLARQRSADRIDFGPARRQRFLDRASAIGVSLGQARQLFCALLDDQGHEVPKPPSRATLGRQLKDACAKATAVLAVLDARARPLARQLAPDEIFCHGKPVLVAVEPTSLAVLLCQRASDRTGATWQHALAPFTALEFAVSDQGSGLQAALQALASGRPSERPLGHGLDLFHTSKEALPVLRRAWQRVERYWGEAERAEAELSLALAPGTRSDARGPAKRAAAAWDRVKEEWDWYDRQERGWKQARRALDLFRPDGQLNDPGWARGQIKQACRALGAKRWEKVRRWLGDGRTTAFLGRMHAELAKAEGRVGLRQALVRLWRLEHGPAGQRSAGRAVVQRVICAKMAEDWALAYARVSAVLERTVRASSCVECINSVLRMQQARHRNLSQGLLDLKRLYWNTRAFPTGRRRRHCPYQLLGLALPTYDFHALLDADPAVLAQKLSTTPLAP
jgi:hypothetical protein